MLRMMIFGAAALLPAAASATSSIMISDDGHMARISYGDLDLGSLAGRSMLTGRIQRAAGLLCFDPDNVVPLEILPTRTECYRTAVASGVDQINSIRPDKAG